MFCKICNTRLEDGASACPNCGAGIAATGPGGRSTEPSRPPPLAPSSGSLDVELEQVLQEAGVEVEPEQPTPAPPGTPKLAPSFNLDPAGLRKQLAERPELLEAGLRVFANDKGTPVGVGYSTGVGAIDLLARDREGGLVVVMVAERDRGAELVAEMLQRIGWVRKHLAEGRRPPRGILLMDRPPENLGYAASAVADTVAFKVYRVALCFEDLSF